MVSTGFPTVDKHQSRAMVFWSHDKSRNRSCMSDSKSPIHAKEKTNERQQTHRIGKISTGKHVNFTRTSNNSAEG